MPTANARTVLNEVATLVGGTWILGSLCVGGEQAAWVNSGNVVLACVHKGNEIGLRAMTVSPDLGAHKIATMIRNRLAYGRQKAA